VLIVKPIAYMSPNAPISDTGIVTIGMIVARKAPQEEEDHQHDQQHRLAIVSNTDLIERSMNTEVS
jgi:hypothetical protein